MQLYPTQDSEAMTAKSVGRGIAILLVHEVLQWLIDIKSVNWNYGPVNEDCVHGERSRRMPDSWNFFNQSIPAEAASSSLTALSGSTI